MSRVSGYQDILMPLLILAVVFIAGVATGVILSTVIVRWIIQQ